MKKFTLLFLYLFIGIFVFAQKATTLLTEDFSSGVAPTGWTIDDMASQWSSSSTTNAGGTAPEAKLSWVSGTHTTHLISPPVDLTGYSSVILSFKHFLSDYSASGYSIGVATRSGGGTWNTVWSVTPPGDMGPETKEVLISNSDVGTSDFQFALFLEGNFYNFNYWYIDDVQLFVPDNNDDLVYSINTNPYQAQGSVNISCTLKNLGLTNMTSVDVNYQIDNGTVVTDNLTGLNIATTETLDHTFSAPWNATPGDYNLKVWISDINGNGADDNSDNDTLNLTMHVATQNVARTPLYEEFTSSTCSPCATFNSQYFTTSFLDNNAGNFSLIKYQMSWPSPGDPYYTNEGGVRRAFYGVSGVPTLFIDANVGTHFDTNQLQADLDNQLAKPTFFNLTADYQISGNNIDVFADILPFLNAQNFTVQIAVVEKTTTGNVGNNGETEFHNVMMKMLPDASGTILNFTSGSATNISESYDMSSTFVEEMNDLEVVVFIQNDETKEIFQSAVALPMPYAEISPDDGETNVFMDKNITVSFLSKMLLADGNEITSENISNFIHVSDPSKGDITYTASINSDKTFIEINPDNNFTPNTNITVTIDDSAVKNEHDKLLTGSSVTFTTGSTTDILKLNNNITISPNPANNFINISGLNKGDIIITDLSGKQLIFQSITSENQQINIQNLHSGVYLVKVISNGNTFTHKFIKQ